MIKKIVLFISFLILTGIYIYSFGNLTIIQTNLSDKSFSSMNYGELRNGKKLEGSFIATDNWLGQVSIRFYNFNRINPDSVIFRIKEQNASSWYYENTYKTDQFQPNLLFPFGFPIVNDSKGRQYVFEVESLNGLPEHSIGISPIKPLGDVLYQYPKSYLLSSPKILLNFTKEKIKKIDLNIESLVAVGIYLNFVILLLFFEYLMLSKISRRMFNIKNFSSSYIITLGLVVLFASAIILYLKKTNLSYSITTIGYFIFIVGVIYAIIESKRK